MDIKVCPECSAEYYSHVDECIDCESDLVLPEEIREIEVEKENFLKQSEGDVVVIREGRTDWIKELYQILNDKNIPSLISLSPGCKPGSCNSTSLLIVGKSDGEESDKLLHEHYLSTNPEARDESDIEGDNCPACGSEAGPDIDECPDCGLALNV